MASSLIGFYCFNDNDAALVHDFSGNERNSTAETGFAISTHSGAKGYVGVFNGTTTVLNFGNITAFNSVTGFSIVTRFKTDAIGARQVISNRQNHHILEITAAGLAKITLYYSGAPAFIIQTSDTLVADTWYTVAVSWDGSDIYIYLDDADNVDDDTASGTALDSVANSLYIGATQVPGDYFDGMIEMISYYSKALTTDEVNAVMESVNGIKYLAGDGMIQTGDLIYTNSGGSEVCIWSEEFDEMLFSDSEEQLFNDGELQIFKN